jgi:hypothetical protein
MNKKARIKEQKEKSNKKRILCAIIYSFIFCILFIGAQKNKVKIRQ